MVEKIEKRICKTVGFSHATYLQPLGHRRNGFGVCSSELAQLVPLPYSLGRSTRCSGRLYDFSFTIPRWYKDICEISFFPLKAWLWNSLSKECFPLTYDLNGFNSRIIRHLLFVV